MNKSIVDIIHNITQLDYQIQFCSDFEGMIRCEFRKEWDNEFYEHSHLGFPGCTRDRLENDILDYLNSFYKEIKDKND